MKIISLYLNNKNYVREFDLIAKLFLIKLELTHYPKKA